MCSHASLRYRINVPIKRILKLCFSPKKFNLITNRRNPSNHCSHLPPPITPPPQLYLHSRPPHHQSSFPLLWTPTPTIVKTNKIKFCSLHPKVLSRIRWLNSTPTTVVLAAKKPLSEYRTLFIQFTIYIKVNYITYWEAVTTNLNKSDMQIHPWRHWSKFPLY